MQPSEPGSPQGYYDHFHSQFNIDHQSSPTYQSHPPQFQADTIHYSGLSAPSEWPKRQEFPGQYVVLAPYARFAGQSYAMPPHTAYQNSPSLTYPARSLSYPTLVCQPPYQQSYRYMAPPLDTGQSGTWWYVPAGSNHASNAQTPYPTQYSDFSSSTREADSYVQSGLSSPRYLPAPQDPATSYPPPREPQVPSGVPPEALARIRNFSMRSRSTGALQTIKPNLSSQGGPKGKRTEGIGRPTHHPNPPAYGSEWVMWVGNVPRDASHGELWRFFTQASTARFSISGDGEEADSLSGGIVSIFLIAHSSCAFVNFQTEPHLQAAIAHFAGLPLRPDNYYCPRLVCRVRGRDDDLKAGVSGQRNSGIHVDWVKHHRENERLQNERYAVSSSEYMPPSSLRDGSTSTSPSLQANADNNGDDGGKVLHPPRTTPPSSSSGSTNSGMLAHYFPKRYFILKSLTQFDLDLSVKQGVWATQHHNEGILDQAFRTSTDVYLIFGVNKSGEFYGYAKMTGPIMHGEHPISWASRSPDSPLHPRQAIQTSKLPVKHSMYFTPHEHWADNSPLPISPDPRPPSDEGSSSLIAATDVHERGFFSAPAELKQPHHKLTMSPHISHSMDQQRLASLLASQQGHNQEGSSDSDHKVQKDAFELNLEAREDSFELDHNAPMRAVREQSLADKDGIKRWDTVLDVVTTDTPPSPLETLAVIAADEGATWGEPFKVEWIRVSRIPFHRTRHLRNPWNHNREVKVSRDGTELDPAVGQALLDEWDKPQPPELTSKGRGRTTKAAIDMATPGTNAA